MGTHSGVTEGAGSEGARSSRLGSVIVLLPAPARTRREHKARDRRCVFSSLCSLGYELVLLPAPVPTGSGEQARARRCVFSSLRRPGCEFVLLPLPLAPDGKPEVGRGSRSQFPQHQYQQELIPETPAEERSPVPVRKAPEPSVPAKPTH
jgi:hypothetical protein